MNAQMIMQLGNFLTRLGQWGLNSWNCWPYRPFARIGFLVLLWSGPIGCSGGDPQSEPQRPSRPERPAQFEAPPARRFEFPSLRRFGSESGRLILPEDGRSSRTEPVPGLIHKNELIRTVPWWVHTLQIDRSRTDFELVSTLAQNTVLGLGPLSYQIGSIPAERGRPLAGINGDFYRVENENYAGDPRGLQILDGELVSAPDGTACFWIDATGTPHMGNVTSQIKVTWPNGDSTPCGLNEERRFNGATLYTPRLGVSTHSYGGRELVLERAGTNSWLPLRPSQSYIAQVREVRETGNTRLNKDVMVLSLAPFLAGRVPKVEPGAFVTISTALSQNLRGAHTALGGGPQLVHEGKPQPATDHRSGQRHPRAAFGWNANYFFFVVVDGRQPGLSMGMTLQELAAYLASQGCEEAMNLDGGGSVELWVNGRVVNSPCFGRERFTANALVVLQKNKPAAAVDRR